MNIVGAIQSEKLASLKRSQYPEKLLMTDTVPAGQEQPQLINISHLGDFLCLYITGTYTTLAVSGEDYVDNGVCALRGQLFDGTGQRKLFNDFIPFDLFCSPGRIKEAGALNTLIDNVAADRADAAMQLFYPMEFQHLFEANSTINISVKNDATYENTYALCFHGIRLIKGR